jgi:hypothetical protein
MINNLELKHLIELLNNLEISIQEIIKNRFLCRIKTSYVKNHSTHTLYYNTKSECLSPSEHQEDLKDYEECGKYLETCKKYLQRMIKLRKI